MRSQGLGPRAIHLPLIGYLRNANESLEIFKVFTVWELIT